MNAMAVEHLSLRFVNDLVSPLDDFLPPNAILDIGDFLVERNLIPDLAWKHAVGVVKKGVLDLDTFVQTKCDEEITFVHGRTVLERYMAAVNPSDFVILALKVLQHVLKPSLVFGNTMRREAGDVFSG